MGAHRNLNKYAVKDCSSYDFIASLPEIRASLPNFAHVMQQSSSTKSGFLYARTEESEQSNGRKKSNRRSD